MAITYAILSSVKATLQITGLFLGYGFDTRYYGGPIANSRIANIS